MSKGMTGKHHSNVTKEKIRKSLKGYKHTKEALKNMSKARKGIKRPPFSNEWKRNMSICRIGKKQSKIAKIRKSKALIKFYSTHPVWNKNTHMNQGRKNGQWKGGIIKHSSGYILIHKPDHPFVAKSGYVFEHRLVMEKKLGRFLNPEETIHHINEIKYDNRPENLMLFKNRRTHQSFHNLKSNEPHLLIEQVR